MTKKEMIEKLKTTWTAFGGLTKEEQEFFTSDKVASNWGYVGATGKFIPSSNDSQILDNMLVRLSPDFKLPEPERWF